MNTMLIANPIYDTVFKYLMENNRVARFFVETIIGQPLESITVKPQEVTYFKSTPDILGKSSLTGEEIKKIEMLSIIRYDFLAIVRTPEGPLKVLIEIQKAHNIVDLMRFRTYLAEQYKRKDVVAVHGVEMEATLPIITIYLLGFELPETDAIAIHVSRTYHDIIAQTELHVKSKFIECLTHDSYIVQIPRIVGKTRTRLERMLNVFEQCCFIDNEGIVKYYNHDVDDDNIRYMLEILHYAGADPKLRKAIEDELRSNRLWEEVIITRDKKIIEQQRVIEENTKALEENAKEIVEKDKALEESAKEIVEKDKALEESAKALEESAKEIVEKDKALEESAKEIEELRKMVAVLTNPA